MTKTEEAKERQAARGPRTIKLGKHATKLIPLDDGSTVHHLKPINPRTPEELIPKLKETPLDNRIIVLEHTPATMSAGGIHLPEASTTKPYTGTVVAIGHQVETVKLRNQVRYPKRAGELVEIDGKEYLMLRETDIYTILNK